MKIPDRQLWRGEAKCRDDDPALYEVENLVGDVGEAAERLCAGCPVIEQCLEDAARVSRMTDFVSGIEPTDLYTSGVVRGGRAFLEGGVSHGGELERVTDPRHAAALLMKDDGATAQEIADRFGVSERTATRWVHLARNPDEVKQRVKSPTCPSGHLFTPENTYNPPGKGRQCRMCKRIRDRARRDGVPLESVKLLAS